MNTFSLTDETAIDVLIFWIESSDGVISYDEDKAVKRALDNMEYSMTTFRQTLSHLGALSNQGLNEAEEEAIHYVKKNFTDDGKRLTYVLLQAVAASGGGIGTEAQKKLDRLSDELGL
jgi:hypothetical protein